MLRFTRAEWALTLAGGAVLAACCPTLWIQVSKTDPAPWPPVRHEKGASDPVLIPSRMQNRFDVLSDGTRVAFQPAYTDSFKQLADPSGARDRALEALRKILAAFGDSPLQTSGPLTAQVKCQVPSAVGLAAKCEALLVHAVPPELNGVSVATPFIVTIANRQAMIVKADPPTQPTTPAVLTLADPIDVKEGATVQVALDSSLVLSAPMLSFLHLSDIQLRDPSVTLTDPRLSAQLDWFQPLWSFQYDTDMEFYNQYLVQAVFDTVNALATTADPPQFIIHTGDSVDSGSISELIRFHGLIDELAIPFYEAFGNHDVLVFGNLTPTSIHDDDNACAPVSSLLQSTSWLFPNKICVDQLVSCPDCVDHEGELIARETMAETRWRFMRQLKHSPTDTVVEPSAGKSTPYCPDTSPDVRFGGYTRDHGFDLGTGPDGNPLGYYAFVRELTPFAGEPLRNAVFIVLDSEELPDHQGGIEGHIGHDQLGWLRSVLDCVARSHPGDLVFVFAHQPLGSIAVDPQDQVEGRYVLADALTKSPNVVAYLYGHNHANSICGDDRQKNLPTAGRPCEKFWEIETASLIEFPQEGRLVRIKQVGKHLAFLELSMVQERLADGSSDLAKFSVLARQGAERDYCHNHPSPSCRTYKRPVRTDGRDTDARLFFKLP
jgi:hypothetical protein